jgi:hypothetical protein
MVDVGTTKPIDGVNVRSSQDHSIAPFVPRFIVKFLPVTFDPNAMSIGRCNQEIQNE